MHYMLRSWLVPGEGERCQDLRLAGSSPLLSYMKVSSSTERYRSDWIYMTDKSKGSSVPIAVLPSVVGGVSWYYPVRTVQLMTSWNAWQDWELGSILRNTISEVRRYGLRSTRTPEAGASQCRGQTSSLACRKHMDSKFLQFFVGSIHRRSVLALLRNQTMQCGLLETCCTQRESTECLLLGSQSSPLILRQRELPAIGKTTTTKRRLSSTNSQRLQPRSVSPLLKHKYFVWVSYVKSDVSFLKRQFPAYFYIY